MWVADRRQIHYSLMAAAGGPWQTVALVSQELPDVLLRVIVWCPGSFLHWLPQSVNFLMDETASPAEASLNSGPPALLTVYEMSDHSKSWSCFYFSFIEPRLGQLQVIIFQPHISASWITDLAHQPAQVCTESHADLNNTHREIDVTREDAELALARVTCMAYYACCLNCKWTFLSPNLCE